MITHEESERLRQYVGHPAHAPLPTRAPRPIDPPSSEAWDTLAREIADEPHTLGELLAATDALAARGGGR